MNFSKTLFVSYLSSSKNLGLFGPPVPPLATATSTEILRASYEFWLFFKNFESIYVLFYIKILLESYGNFLSKFFISLLLLAIDFSLLF